MSAIIFSIILLDKDDLQPAGVVEVVLHIFLVFNFFEMNVIYGHRDCETTDDWTIGSSRG